MPDRDTQQQIDAYVKALTTPQPDSVVGWAELDRRLDQEERAREPKITDQEWAAYVDKIDRQYEPPQRSEWYRQTQAEHNLDLAAPQRFPLTGDGLVSQRIIADGPFNGPDIGAELAMARYRDHQHAQDIEPLKQEQTRVRSLSI